MARRTTGLDEATRRSAATAASPAVGELSKVVNESEFAHRIDQHPVGVRIAVAVERPQDRNRLVEAPVVVEAVELSQEGELVTGEGAALQLVELITVVKDLR